MTERYQYNYKPSGENVDEIVNWLKNQHDKGYSLNLIIRKAIHQYGLNTDLKQYMTDRFINDGYQATPQVSQTITAPIDQSSTATVKSPNTITATPSHNTQHVTKPQPKPSSKPTNPNSFLQKPQEDDQTDLDTDTDESPNFGFLNTNDS